MPNEGFGQSSKKETVYGGPAIATKQGTVYGGPPVQTGGGTVYGGTVYNGPTGGTVYGGPTPGGVGARPITGRTNSPSSTNAGAAYGAKVFYLIAGLTVFRTVLTLTGARIATTGSKTPNNVTSAILVAAVVAGIFVLLGFFAKRGSKIAFVIGTLIYAADLVLLASGDPSSHAVGIGIHGWILFLLIRAFRQLP